MAYPEFLFGGGGGDRVGIRFFEGGGKMEIIQTKIMTKFDVQKTHFLPAILWNVPLWRAARH